jgi:hypothetical protein
MPEPVKPVDRRIFGYEVETSIFKKYNHQNYSIGFGFYDLAGVERWATDPERAAEFPEMAAEAKQIKERIIAEITGKDMNTMKTPRTAADFIDALNDIYTETRSRYTTLNERVKNAEKQLERAQEKARGGDRIAQARLEVARADLREAQDACRNEYGKMMNDYNARVKELRGQFADHLNKHYAASPDKLDTATMQLLGSGICTPDELLSLVERHKDCPTMVRIIGSYADKMIENRRNMGQSEVNALQTVRNYAAASKNGNREMAIFDSAASATKYGLDKKYDHATRMDSHMSGWFDDFKQNLNNLPVIPEEMAPAESSEE